MPTYAKYCLRFSKWEVRDKGLKELAVLKNFQMLTMWGTKATAAGIAALRKELSKCDISDQ
jgi:hypothetical protein